ncbi:choice-of-anchor P family protein [Nocardioides sp. SYSU D00065]|uniref:choice-of-anchor P family protein n=1 Tax=Nocardioides sp. SYSU D00065 TaxID=2817378 RepID=UPI001B339421|nr:choice-of-anchor P family protein [Nocardioides sp. SYSU D00065]
MERISRSRTLAALSLGLSAALALSSAVGVPAQGSDPIDARAGSAPQLTDFGYRGDVYGVKLVTDSVESLNLKDAHAQQLCTRAVGQVVERESAVSVPDNPLIHVSASTSRTETYVDGDTHGVRGTNTIGDIAIGGTVGPLTTPRLVIKGLRTTANAFNTPQGFGHAESFTFASISLELLDNTVVQSLPPELQQLLAPLDQVTDTVFTGTQQVAQQVFQVLTDVTRPIQIPGLGTIALGYKNGRANSHNAQSQASALRIEVTAGDRRQLVELGTARVRMGGPAPVGVFRSGGTAMDYQALQGALRFGNVEHKALPCQGSNGRTQTYQVPHASQLLPVPVLLDGVTYQVNGDQFRAKKVAKGWSRTAISSVSVPSAQLVINDVSSRAAMRQKAGKRVTSKISTAIGSITVGGQAIAVPAPGEVVELPNGAGEIQRQVVDTGYRGSQVIALRLTLYSEAVVIDLARTAGRIYPR